MTKRDFFILIIRIFGLYWFIQAIAFTLPSQIGFVLQYGDAKTLVWLILVFIIMMAVLMLLLFYAPWLVDKLKLLKGFDDERIEFGRMNSTDLYRGCFFYWWSFSA